MAGLVNLFQLISLDRCVPASPRRHAALKTRGGLLRLPARSKPIRGGVVCMAHPRRIAKVSKQIEREISNMLLYDQALQKAVCPEKRLGFDSMESAIASVTEVQVTNDLQVAKVYVSVYSDSQGKKRAMEGLMRLQGYVRRSIGQRMRLRLTPDIRFVYDDTYERTARIDALLRRVELEKQGKVEPPPIALPGGNGCESEDEEDDEEWAAEEELEEDGFLDELEAGDAAATSGISYTSKKEKARMLAGRSRARRRDGSGGKPSPGRRR